jgi:cytochrome b
MAEASKAEDRRLVWDLPLRLFHWLFAAGIFAAWATAKAGFDWMQWHFYLGYGLIALLVFRIIWGFFGPRHARFSSFLRKPSAVWLYAKSLFSRSGMQSIGHNPVGGLMVLLMIVLVAVQAATGLFTTDDVVWAGPYNPAVSKSTASWLSTVHNLNFNFILGAIGLHLAAIAFYTFVKQQNLVVPMLTGHKPATLIPAHEAISSSELLKAVIVSAISGGFVYWLVTHAPPATESLY